MSVTFPNSKTIHTFTLPNGLTLLVYENFATQSVVINGTLRTGAWLETASQAGLSEFVADMLMRGTQQHTFAQIYAHLEQVGGRMGFDSGRYLLDVSARGLVEDIDLLLTLMSQSLRTPTFPEAQISLIRGQLRTAQQIEADDANSQAYLLLRQLLYGKEAMNGRSLLGTPHTLNTLQQKDLIHFHQTTYTPNNMILVIVGGIEANEAYDKVTAVLGDWQPTHNPPPFTEITPTRPTQTTRQHHPMPHKSQCSIFIGGLGPRRTAPDHLTASLMNCILGEFGAMGRLGQIIREEQGLAYDVVSHLQGSIGTAPWYAYAGVDAQHVNKTIDHMLAELQRIQAEPVTEEELADVKAYHIGALPVHLESNQGIANTIAQMILYDRGLDYLQQYADLVNRITIEQIQAVAQTYLNIEQAIITVAGNIQ